jgi:hypothetical protein
MNSNRNRPTESPDEDFRAFYRRTVLEMADSMEAAVEAAETPEWYLGALYEASTTALVRRLGPGIMATRLRERALWFDLAAATAKPRH